MATDGFQFQKLEWKAYLLHISAWLQDRFCRKPLQNFKDHSHYTVPQARRGLQIRIIASRNLPFHPRNPDYKN